MLYSHHTMNDYQREYINKPDYDVLTEELFGVPFGSFVKQEHKGVVDGVYHCSNERLNSYFNDLNLIL